MTDVETKTVEAPKGVTIGELVSTFYEGIEELASEMEEWRSNMEEKLSATEKYSRVEEAAQALEQVGGNMPEINDEDVDAEPFTPPKLAKKASRSDRRAWAIAHGQEAVDRIRNLPDTEVVIAREVDALRELADRLEALNEAAETIESDISDAEGVEFPGAFGG